MAQAHRTLEAPVGGPSRSPGASPASSWNLRALPGDGGWPSPGVHVTCPENRGHNTGGGLPSQAHHPHFTDERTEAQAEEVSLFKFMCEAEPAPRAGVA